MEVGLRILDKLRINQAELDERVNEEQGEGSGLSQGQWAAWARGEAFGLSWVLQLLLSDLRNKSCLMEDTQLEVEWGRGIGITSKPSLLPWADIVIFHLFLERLEIPPPNDTANSMTCDLSISKMGQKPSTHLTSLTSHPLSLSKAPYPQPMVRDSAF